MWLPSQCSKPHQGVIKKVWFIILNYKFLKNSFTTIIKVNISGIIAIMSKIKICINIISNVSIHITSRKKTRDDSHTFLRITLFRFHYSTFVC